MTDNCLTLIPAAVATSFMLTNALDDSGADSNRCTTNDDGPILGNQCRKNNGSNDDTPSTAPTRRTTWTWSGQPTDSHGFTPIRSRFVTATARGTSTPLNTPPTPTKTNTPATSRTSKTIGN